MNARRFILGLSARKCTLCGLSLGLAPDDAHAVCKRMVGEYAPVFKKLVPTAFDAMRLVNVLSGDKTRSDTAFWDGDDRWQTYRDPAKWNTLYVAKRALFFARKHAPRGSPTHERLVNVVDNALEHFRVYEGAKEHGPGWVEMRKAQLAIVLHAFGADTPTLFKSE